MRRALGFLSLFLGLCGCKATTTTPPSGDDSGLRPAPQTEVERPLQGTCGPGGERLETYDFLPANVRIAASLDLADKEMGEALHRVSEHAGGSGHDLPIDVAFSLAQWSWQVPLLLQTLDRGGFVPAELVFAQLPGPLPVWFFRATCDVEHVTRRVEACWGLSMLETVDALIGTTPAGSSSNFAYDLLVLSAGRLALVPRGSASALLEHLARASPDVGPSSIPSPGSQLEQLEPAPVRIIVKGQGLLGSGASGDEDPRGRGLRATARELFSDDDLHEDVVPPPIDPTQAQTEDDD